MCGDNSRHHNKILAVIHQRVPLHTSIPSPACADVRTYMSILLIAFGPEIAGADKLLK